VRKLHFTCVCHDEMSVSNLLDTSHNKTTLLLLLLLLLLSSHCDMGSESSSVCHKANVNKNQSRQVLMSRKFGNPNAQIKTGKQKANKQSSRRCLELCSFSHRQTGCHRHSPHQEQKLRVAAAPARRCATPPPPFLALCLFLCISTLAFLDTT